MATITATPDRGALSGPLIGLSFLSGVAGGIVRSHYPYPRPGSDAAQIRQYFSQPSRAARISVAGQATSVLALLRFTATVAKLAGRAGRGSRALQAAAVAGGGIAAASLATSAACAAALTAQPGEDAATAVTLYRRGFLAGGPIHGAGFGLLVGALSLAGLRTKALPRAVASAGLVSTTAGLLSPLYLIFAPAAWLIPIARFPGLIVSGIAGFLLSRRTS